MTAEREEVLDYVTPYFDQTGITIGKFGLRAIYSGCNRIITTVELRYYNYCKCQNCDYS